MTHSEWFWEGNVQAAVGRHLEANGWTLESAADTASSQPGVDLVLTRLEERMLVEVKGWPSETYARGERQGQRKPTRPSTQARHWYAEVLLSCALLRGAHGDVAVAIALPRFNRYVDLIARTAHVYSALGFRLLLLDPDGTVTETDPLSLIRPPDHAGPSPLQAPHNLAGHTGKYRLLWQWLRTQQGDRLEVTMAEIEGILGFPLPPSSRRHPAHWSGYEGSAVARAIADAGWRARPDLAAQEVVLIKVATLSADE